MNFDDLIQPELGKITGPKGGWTNQHTAYIPTVFIVPPELNVGEFWYVKYQGGNCLAKVLIKDVTEKTVYLEEYNHNGSYAYNSRRYKKTDIEFVEKVKENA